MKTTKFNKSDLVMVLIPEPNVTNYNYQKYNYQLGIVEQFHPDTGFYKDDGYSIILDENDGLFEPLRHIVRMYADHILLIEKGAFK